MGQEICALITNQKIEVNNSIVNFKEGTSLIIPLDLSRESIHLLISEAANFINLNEYLSFLKEMNIDLYIDKEAEEYKIHDIYFVIELLEKYDLKSFMIRYYTEFSDIPVDVWFLTVINGKIRLDSIMLEEEEFEHNYFNRKKYQELIDEPHNWLANEDRYFSYNEAYKNYYKINS